MRTCDAVWLGSLPYQEAWDLQIRLAEEIAFRRRPPTLLLLEHPHTFTFGSRGQAANLLWDGDELARRGASLHWVDRGGDITYHGPGQLVGYPLIPLGPPKRVINTGEVQEETLRIPSADYTGYLRRLEEMLIHLLAGLGVASQQVPGLTGVWTIPHGEDQPAKIAAIGVKVDRFGVSRHGFALNVQPDMSYFEGIIACGLVGHPITSLAAHLALPPSVELLAPTAANAFGQVFNYEINFHSGISLS